jgi:hypothetical protein
LEPIAYAVPRRTAWPSRVCTMFANTYGRPWGPGGNGRSR